MTRAVVLAAIAALLALAAVSPGPAAAARPTYEIPENAVPPDPYRAIVILRDAARRAAPGSRTRQDIDYVLRLGYRYLRPGQPAGRRTTVSRTLRVNAWWYRTRGAPRYRNIVADWEGIVSTYWEGRGYAVNPVATTGRWQGVNADFTSEQLAEALIPFGVERGGAARPFMLWEYYDVPDRPGRIAPGASGMAQGRIAQIMSNAYQSTADARFADAARLALMAFTVPVAQGGVRSRVTTGGRAPGYWYVERAYPGASPWKGAALNGFMVTLLNLETAGRYLRSAPRALTTGPAEERARPKAPGAEEAGELARDLLRDGETTLARYLPLHDTGRWSLYSLLSPSSTWRTYLASDGYHCYHVKLLEQLQRVSPSFGFGAVAKRWNDYARRVGVRCEGAGGPDRPPRDLR
ncbi:MAG: D-glucuronyl C5-epimerase family protein [Thermoleophilia bacterium]